MVTRLLSCEKGFLDSDEFIPVEAKNLSEVGRFGRGSLTDEQIGKATEGLGAGYWAQPYGGSIVVAYEFVSSPSQSVA
ncbi:MAG: hypothetical protein ABIH37_04925 [archaeon]